MRCRAWPKATTTSSCRRSTAATRWARWPVRWRWCAAPPRSCISASATSPRRRTPWRSRPAGRAGRKGLRLVRRGTGPPAMVEADEKRLGQVLRNLLGNAVKFTDGGEVALRVDTTPLDDATVAMRFEVTDSGIGIHPADLKT